VTRWTGISGERYTPLLSNDNSSNDSKTETASTSPSRFAKTVTNPEKNPSRFAKTVTEPEKNPSRFAKTVTEPEKKPSKYAKTETSQTIPVRNLPIMPNKPLFAETSAGTVVVSLDIWRPDNSPISSNQLDENGKPLAGSWYLQNKDVNSQIQQMAKYLFDLAKSGVVGFRLQGIPNTDDPLPKKLESQLSSFCKQHNLTNPSNPVNLELNSKDGTCAVINTNVINSSEMHNFIKSTENLIFTTPDNLTVSENLNAPIKFTRFDIMSTGHGKDTISPDTTSYKNDDPHDLINGTKRSEFNPKVNYSATSCDSAVTELWGRRDTQEDRILMGKLNDTEKMTEENWHQALKQTIAGMEKGVEDNHLDNGSCLCVNVVVGTVIHTGNIGDSSADVVIIDAAGNHTIQRLNTLHNPADDTEKNRIEAAGGEVKNGRINGELAVSRAIGDTRIEGVTHDPDISSYSVTIPPGGTAFLITACDGLTEPNSMHAKISGIVASNKNKGPEAISAALAIEAYKEGSQDNISVIVTPIDPKNTQPRLAAVFDGHGGDQVSEYLYQNFENQLKLEAKAQLGSSAKNTVTASSYATALRKQQYEMISISEALNLEGVAIHPRGSSYNGLRFEFSGKDKDQLYVTVQDILTNAKVGWSSGSDSSVITITDDKDLAVLADFLTKMDTKHTASSSESKTTKGTETTNLRDNKWEMHPAPNKSKYSLAQSKRGDIEAAHEKINANNESTAHEKAPETPNRRR